MAVKSDEVTQPNDTDPALPAISQDAIEKDLERGPEYPDGVVFSGSDVWDANGRLISHPFNTMK